MSAPVANRVRPGEAKGTRRDGNNVLAEAIALLIHHNGPWDGWGGGEWWWFVGRMFFLTVWVFLIVLAVRWFRLGGGRRGPTGMERARDILAERYARGEISTEEYKERIERLR